MKKIVIDFLAESDYTQNVSYKAAKPSIAKIAAELILRCKRLEDIREKLQGIDSNNEPLLITFMAHGYPKFLRTVTDGAYLDLYYTELIPVLNACKGKYPVIINLLGTCNSHGLQNFLGASPIDEWWVTNTTTMSLDKALLARELGNYEEFHENLEGDDLDLYQKITRP